MIKHLDSKKRKDWVVDDVDDFCLRYSPGS